MRALRLPTTADTLTPVPGALVLDAPAKVNLFLKVTGQRRDGYHLLRSLTVFTDICDRLTVESGTGIEFVAKGPCSGDLPSDTDDNLVVRAAETLRVRLAETGGARLVLEKVLPVASGIGGGSADAAAALRLLARLWAGRVDEGMLAHIASGLGADVPVCLAGKPALVSGTGEEIEPVAPLPACGVVLANGGEPVSTAAVFSAIRGPYSMYPDWRPSDGLDGLVAALAGLDNDLTRAARILSPVVEKVLDAIDQTPDCLIARMSGSGGTCFGIFPDHGAAARAAAMLQSGHDTWWVKAGSFRADRPLIRNV